MRTRLGCELFQFEPRTVPALVTWQVVAVDPDEEIGADTTLTITGADGQSVESPGGAGVPEGAATLTVSGDDIVDEDGNPVTAEVYFTVDNRYSQDFSIFLSTEGADQGSSGMGNVMHVVRGEGEGGSGLGDFLRAVRVDIQIVGEYQDKYPDYVAAVDAAASSYTSAVNGAYADYTSVVGSANATAQQQADALYFGYTDTANQAYSAYSAAYQEAYQGVTDALSQANAALTAAAAEAGSAFTNTISDTNAVLNSALLANQTALNGAISTSGAQYLAAANAAWDNGDIAGIDAAFNSYLDAVAEAASSFNANNQADQEHAQSAVDDAISALDAALTSADDAWTATMQAAVAAFYQTMDDAWDQYESAESAAWTHYQSGLASLSAQQQTTINTAWNQFQATLSEQSQQFADTEQSAWGAYLDSLAEGQEAGARLGMPQLAAMPQLVAAAPAQGAPVQNNNEQGKLPPIDWSKGTLVADPYAPWGGAEPNGRVYKVEIGKDSDGKPIEINCWQAYGPTKLDWHYFCHGLTFNGGGGMSYSPFTGNDVAKILEKFYKAIPGSSAQPGDIVVFFHPQNGPDHSCVIITPSFKPDGSLDPEKTTVRTKNGPQPIQDTTLAQVMKDYPGRQVYVYTRK